MANVRSTNYNDHPYLPTSLIGREWDVAAVSALLTRPGVRLVTLTGPGGIGKTRLAIAVAESVVDAFHDGIVFVTLQALVDPGLVLSAVAQALGVREADNQPLAERLVERLHDRPILLVLDNFEHLLPAAVVIDELLAACPALSFLVTSRAVLRLYGEHIYLVPPLTVPDASPGLRLDQMGGNDAVRLFVERAQAAKAVFRLTPENAADVGAICVRLDGLPLAIELAAARIRLLSPAALLARLEQRLHLLAGGPRNVPPRQQTLRATIAWSYDLLAPDQQRLFRQLAIFSGGWTLEAAVAVGGDEGQTDVALLDQVTALIDQSLVLHVDQATGEPRFTMLETIREYGLERLECHGETDDVQRRHAAYLLALAERLGRQWVESANPDQGAILQILQQFATELDNLRAALGWLEAHGAREPAILETALRMSGTVWYMWRRLGRPSEARRWTEALLAQRAPTATAAGASALNGAGFLALEQSDFVRARAYFEASFDLADDLGNDELRSTALLGLGLLASKQGDDERAQRLSEEALRLARPLGKILLIVSLIEALGRIAVGQGDYARAIALYEDGLEISAEYGAIPSVLHGIGLASLLKGDSARARQYLTEGLRANRTLGKSRFVGDCLEGFAYVAVSQGQSERAVCLLGAADQLLEDVGTSVRTANSIYADFLARSKTQLPEPAWSAAWIAGRELSFEEAVDYALAGETEGETNSTAQMTSGLSRRELDVLRLIVEGHPDREIAGILSVSHRTVGNHVSNILAKLDVPSRTAAATLAIREGFVRP